MVALCLDDGESPNYHEDDLREAEKLMEEMDDSGELQLSFVVKSNEMKYEQS